MVKTKTDRITIMMSTGEKERLMDAYKESGFLSVTAWARTFLPITLDEPVERPKAKKKSVTSNKKVPTVVPTPKVVEEPEEKKPTIAQLASQLDPESQDAQIYKLWNQKVPNKTIAQTIGVSVSTVTRRIKKWKSGEV